MSDSQSSLSEFISEELELTQLHQLGRQLANEVARLGKVVAVYECDFAISSKKYKLEVAKAKVLYKDSRMSPTMINAIAETSQCAVEASNELQCVEALLLIGKAELEGRDKQYTMVKKLIDLKVQELRVFRG